MTTQHTEGEGKQPTHTHAAITHDHDRQLIQIDALLGHP